MHILGINFSGHDSSVAIIKDGVLIAAAAEERFTRQKHTGVFPFKSLDYCLKTAGVNLMEIDHIGLYWNPGHELGTIADTRDYVRDNREFLYFFVNQLMTTLPRDQRAIEGIVQEIKFKGKKNPTRFYFCEHHLTHAASAFFVSPYKEAAILTIDSFGEDTTTMFSHGKGNKIEILKELKLPHSVGQLYTTFTQYLGFRPNGGEGKVMGLASYGKPTQYEKFQKLVHFLPDGNFELELKYFEFYRKTGRRYSDYLIELFGPPRMSEAEPMTDYHMDIAASLQKMTEDLMIHFAKHIKKITNSDTLCMAGGVILNGVGNGKIYKTGLFKDVWTQPAAHDVGTSLGTAYYIYNQLLDKPRNFVQIHDYWGPGYTNDEIQKMLDLAKIPYTKHDNIEAVTAKLIADNKIIGWFQGRMEFGPRALGNRTILANPCNPKMKDILNKYVKHREGFRPFAPSVLEEKVGEYFDESYPSPFMLLVWDVLEEKRSVIPAVTHVDGTGRVQSVSKQENPRYYKLIQEFEKITGVPIVLNTSFNIRSEPMVCSPQDALKCFIATGMDYLVMENFLISKESIPLFKEQSEKALNRV